MVVTEVEIVFVKPRDGLFAFASVVLDDQLYLGGIGIHRKLDCSGCRLTYPTRKLGNSQAYICHPIRKPLAATIERAIFKKLNDVESKVDAGHHSTYAEPNGV